MLYTYPIAAVEKNWIHDCIAEILETIHGKIRAGEEIGIWPDVVPDTYRDRLRSRRGLKNRIDDYVHEFQALSAEFQDSAMESLARQNQIEQLLNCSCDPIGIDDHSDGFCSAVHELFKFCFKLLTDFMVRDAQYKIIYDCTAHHVCPFCGLDHFDAPQAPRHSHDHYLARNKYPFAGANLRNLVPMCDRCNSSYKGFADVLHKDGYRRRVFDPYREECVSISLLRSEFVGGVDAGIPNWVVDFIPELLPQIEAWDDVFKIRERYIRDHLNDCFFKWLEEFANYCIENNRSADTDTALTESIENYIRITQYTGLQDRAFLKSAVFKYLNQECCRGNSHAIQIIRRRFDSASAYS